MATISANDIAAPATKTIRPEDIEGPGQSISDFQKRASHGLNAKPQDLPENFPGTIANDFANLPAAALSSGKAYLDAQVHPVDAAIQAYHTLSQIPSDVLADMKAGKWGKLAARAAEFVAPGLETEQGTALLGAAREAASSTADTVGTMARGAVQGVKSNAGAITDAGTEGAGLGFVGGGPVGAVKVGALKATSAAVKSAIQGIKDALALRRWNQGVEASKQSAPLIDLNAPGPAGAPPVEPAAPPAALPPQLGGGAPLRPPLGGGRPVQPPLYRPPAGLDTSAVPVQQAPNNLSAVAQQAQASTLESAPPPAGSPPATEPSSPLNRPDVNQLAQQLFEEAQRSGTVPPNAKPGEPIGGAEPQNPEAFQQRARTKRGTDAEAIAQMFHENEIPSGKLGQITMEQWRDVAKAAGIEFPKTAPALRKLLFDVNKKLQGLEAPQ